MRHTFPPKQHFLFFYFLLMKGKKHLFLVVYLKYSNTEFIYKIRVVVFRGHQLMCQDRNIWTFSLFVKGRYSEYTIRQFEIKSQSLREGDYLCAYLNKAYKMDEYMCVCAPSLQHRRVRAGFGVVTSCHESASAAGGMKLNL